MAHRVDYGPDGTTARVTLDLDGASLDSDAGAIGSQWQTLKNVLTHIPGVLTKRGAIVNAGANSTNINTNSGSVAFYDGVKRTAATYRAYLGVCVNGSFVEVYAQDAGTSRSIITSSARLGVPVSKLPVINGWLVVCGVDAGSLFPTRPYNFAMLYGGSTALGGSSYSAGTVASTIGSTTVTGTGTTWTSSMEGAFMGINSAPELATVKKVVSATSIILDRPAVATGSGLSYRLIPNGYVVGVAGSVCGSSGTPSFKVACGAYRRLVVAHTREPGSASTAYGDDTPEYPYRVRWSGIVGSSEGTSTTYAGMFGWDPNGYIDLADKYGEIAALAPFRDLVLVFQASGLTVLAGQPVFDGAGSLDASQVYPNVAINGGFAYESTPLGVFFFDKNVGPCVYDGSSVQRLGDARVTRTMLPFGITAVGFYDGKVLFSGTTSAGIFVYDTRTSQWSFHLPPATVSCLIAGRVENDEDVVGLGSGTRVVNLANMIDNPGVAATDWTGASFVADVKTGKIGNPLELLRPEVMYLTYRLTDLSATDPYVSTTITTGLPDTSDSQHTWSNAATDLIETVDVETKRVAINLDHDPMTQIRILQNNAAGKFELYSVVVDCAVEGEGISS